MFVTKVSDRVGRPHPSLRGEEESGRRTHIHCSARQRPATGACARAHSRPPDRRPGSHCFHGPASHTCFSGHEHATAGAHTVARTRTRAAAKASAFRRASPRTRGHAAHTQRRIRQASYTTVTIPARTGRRTHTRTRRGDRTKGGASLLSRGTGSARASETRTHAHRHRPGHGTDAHTGMLTHTSAHATAPSIHTRQPKEQTAQRPSTDRPSERRRGSSHTRWPPRRTPGGAHRTRPAHRAGISHRARRAYTHTHTAAVDSRQRQLRAT